VESFCAASVRWLGSVGSALLAEADAIWDDGIGLIHDGTRDHIVVETNAQELVLLWKNIAKAAIGGCSMQYWTTLRR